MDKQLTIESSRKDIVNAINSVSARLSQLIKEQDNKKKQVDGTSIVICSICGKQMDIKEWMQANLHSAWSGCSDNFLIPHMNRSHPCNACGHLWLSTDALVTVGNILIWEYIP